MKRFLCLLLVALMIAPGACAEGIDDIDIAALFGDTPIEEYSDSELEVMLMIAQYLEEYIQSELDSRAGKNSTASQKSTATPIPSSNSNKLKINGTTKEVNVEGFGITMQYAYTESKNGKNYLIVVFSAKNNTDSSSSFGLTINIDAYQNGVELDTGYIYGIETNSSTKFRPGATIEGREIFELTSTTAQVEIELNKLWNFTNAKPTVYTIDIK